MSNECFVINDEFVVKGQRSAAQLPLFHIVCLLTKLTNFSERERYAGTANFKKHLIWMEKI